MGIFDAFRANPVDLDPLEELRETVVQETLTNQLLVERIEELETAAEASEWVKLSAELENEFTRDFLTRLINLSRLMYLKNPLINRAVDVQSLYIWGQGVSISSKDVPTNAAIQAFLDEDKTLSSHQSRMSLDQELAVTGNVFLALFTDSVSSGSVKVRRISVEEIDDIIRNPEDKSEPWFYRRLWTVQTLDDAGQMVNESRIAYYPDWRYQPTNKPSAVGDYPIHWDSPIYHIKVGGFDYMKFGIPETYASLDWARGHKEFLENWSTITKAYARFAFQYTTKGGPSKVQKLARRLNTTLTTDAQGRVSGESNPAPNTASTLIAPEGDKYEPIRTAGATTSAADGRQLLLMVAAGVGLPETFFGDVSVGTLATATSMDRPTEFKFQNRQILWGDVLKDIIQYYIDQQILTPNGSLVDTSMVVKAVPKTDEGEKVEADKNINIDWPPLIEADPARMIDGVVKAQPFLPDDELIARMLLTLLGQDDLDELIGGMDFEAMRAKKELELAAKQAEIDVANATVAGTPATGSTPAPNPAGPAGTKGANRSVSQQEAYMELMRETKDVLREVLGR